MHISRRSFIKKAGVATVSLALTPLLSKCSKKSKNPNIVLILADDLGYGDLSCYGQKNFTTPHIDSLAKTGMKFTQHYAGSTVCAPSRCVLMTGKHTGHAYVRGNKQDEPCGQLQLPPEEKTFAKVLQENGYKTGCFGKWGMGIQNTKGDPQRHGFDTFVGFYDQVLAHNSFPEFLYKNGQKIMLDNDVHYLPESEWHKGLGSYSTEKKDYVHNVIFDELTQWVDENKDEPFFLYFPTTIPHDNGEALKDQMIEVPEIKQEFKNKKWSQDQKNYATIVTLLDDYVGKLLQQLKDLNLEENTIVIFTSDNGAMSASWNKKLESNGKLRGFKRDLYEGGIRIPLIAKWPGKVKANSESDHLSAFWDFYPTMIDIAGIESSNKDIDGISFYPELVGTKQPKHEYLYWEFHFWKPSRQAVRFDNWKAVKNSPDGKIELYSLDKDVGEHHNVADQYPDIVNRAGQYLDKARMPDEKWPLKN
ncbi:MAG: sulfatase-like hydrolase/transferase [Fidelibacterota bacterium]